MSIVPMLSSLSKIVSHELAWGVKRGMGWERSDQWLVGIGAVNFKHETRLEWGSHPALMATTPSQWFLPLKTLDVIAACCRLLYKTVHIFILCRLKINCIQKLRHLRLFLGLLAWLRTYCMCALFFTPSLLPLASLRTAMILHASLSPLAPVQSWFVMLYLLPLASLQTAWILHASSPTFGTSLGCHDAMILHSSSPTSGTSPDCHDAVIFHTPSPTSGTSAECQCSSCFLSHLWHLSRLPWFFMFSLLPLASLQTAKILHASYSTSGTFPDCNDAMILHTTSGTSPGCHDSPRFSPTSGYC